MEGFNIISGIPSIPNIKKPNLKLTVYDFGEISEILEILEYIMYIDDFLKNVNVMDPEYNPNIVFNKIDQRTRQCKELNEIFGNFLVNLNSNICKIRRSIRDIIYKPRSEINVYFRDREPKHLKRLSENYSLDNLYILYHAIIQSEVNIMKIIDKNSIEYSPNELENMFDIGLLIIYKPIVELMIISEFTKKIRVNLIVIDNLKDIHPKLSKIAPNSQINIHLNSKERDDDKHIEILNYRVEEIEFVDTINYEDCEKKLGTYLESL